VYNVEKYLHRCLDSILAQTFTDFELLLIDDGSSDSSGKICDEYAAKDSRFQVFHKENGGVSSARNMGLDNAKGEWVAFVDADDTINSNALYNIPLKFSDIIILNSYVVDNITHALYAVCSYPLSKSEKNFSGIETFRFYNRSSAWGVIYNKKFLFDNKILFDKRLKNAEDTVFFAQCMIFAKQVIHYNIDFYYVYLTENSASRSWTFERILQMSNSLDVIQELIINHKLSIHQLAIIHNLTYAIICNMVDNFIKLGIWKNYYRLKKVILKHSLYPIRLNNRCLEKHKIKIRLLNSSFDLFMFLFLLKSLMFSNKK
jgi:glycosyltransferase involved in cell wall biosynthesis